VSKPCATHEVVDCPMCTVYVGEMGETSEGFNLRMEIASGRNDGWTEQAMRDRLAATQPDTDAPPTREAGRLADRIFEEAATTEGFIRWVAGFDIGLPVENEDGAVFDYYRAIVRKARDHTRTLDPTPSDAPQEGRHPDVKRLASWLRGSYGHAFPRVDWEADAAEVLDLFASDYSAPQEGRPTNEAALGESRDLFGTLYGSGRPTTPQTEAGYREAVPDLLRMLVTDPSVSASFREAANRWIDEAAAGALPSVERLDRFTLEHVREGYRGDKSHWFGQWLDSLIDPAAPPVASER
jgi:hypothetical protein